MAVRMPAGVKIVGGATNQIRWHPGEQERRMSPFVRYKFIRWFALVIVALLALEVASYAQYEGAIPPPPPAQVAQHPFSQQELDQMLAPIALYPDPLLSQILMASTYPLEVVEAARWSRDNPALKGDEAVRVVQERDWDPSVKSLTAFPQILQMMDERLEWTEQLGDAFLSQQTQVTDTIQNLRQRAYAAGNLRSSDQIRVVQDGQILNIDPVNPEVVYVPYYDPMVVYGSWWWPDYPPVYWAPWPGYYYGPGYAPGFAWDVGIVITTGFFFGGFDWHHHRAHVVNVRPYYYHRIGHHERPGRPEVNASPGVWHHDPQHRHGVPYREPNLHQQFGGTGASADTHRGYRGYDQSAIPTQPENRHGTGAGEQEPRLNFQNRPQIRPEPRVTKPAPGAPALSSRPAPEIRPPALEGIGHGSNVQDYSSRGRASQEGAAQRQHVAPPPRQSGTRPQGGIRPPGRRGD